jgi:ADP-dependent NAD(P)H-hydrate dehydratase / NAD(P)H-hydrate epimerase
MTGAMATNERALPMPRRIDAFNGAWPLFGRAASQAAEAEALMGRAAGELMARAGMAAARLVLARWPRARRVLVLAGPGNNGGDGWVLAQRLHRIGQAVAVWPVRVQGAGAADAHAARSAAVAAGVEVLAPSPEAVDSALARADLVVDALLGLGATTAPTGALAEALGRLASRPPIALLALDLPSGLDVDTGQPWPGSPALPAATATLALLTLKPGLFTGQGRDLAGEVWFDDLAATTAVAPTARLAGPPPQTPIPHAWHKGSRGDVWVVGGDDGMDGAALLAADAALRGGAGRVLLHRLCKLPQVAQPPTLLGLAAACLTDATAMAGATVVLGCGGGPAVAATMPALLAGGGRLVIDADGLNAIAHDGALTAALRARRDRGAPSVLTPHPLEAARLLGCSTAAVQADRIASAQRLADTCGATVVLKGSGSVVAAPGSVPFVNPSGNAALATAGSGDVLAGWIAALWSQSPQASAQTLAAGAVWQHGDAADRWWAAGHAGPLPASELAAWMAQLNTRG